MTLKNNAPVSQKLDEFVLKEIDKDKLYKFLREMEFNRLLSSAISAYGEPDFSKKNTENKNVGSKNLINKSDYHLITDIKEIDVWIKEAEEIGEIAVDTETSSLDPHQANLIGISLSTKMLYSYWS